MGWLVFVLAVIGIIWLLATGSRERELKEERERQARLDANEDGDTHSPRASKREYRKPGQPTHRITYTDAEGNTTQRNIALYKTGHTNARCEAWCETRQERRTFLFARVQHAVDLSTGEVLTKAGFFSAVHPTRRVPDTLKI